MDQESIPKTYNAKDWEEKLYTLWQESGFFNPDNLPGERTQTFSTIMPPPNANGRLHAGHGLDMTLKDIATRYKRMAGYKALFVPGADHAGFETQIVYERKLESEGRSRFDMQPEELYKNILEFTLENKKHMESDIRRMGASCDWSRSLFTLDEKVIKQVHETFKKMFDDGLVYRGSRIVNWCSKHQTSLSEVETEYIEKSDPFYYFQYGPFVIGTARPETKFGDKYVVMHPDDERFAEYTDGQKIEVEWITGKITATIIKDAAVDKEFGTGVMTITPWHDPIDFDIAERHKLDREQIIDFDGKLLPIAGEFAGLSIEEARKKIIEKLDAKGLLVKTDNEYQHSVKVCYKCSTAIEPQIKSQWFVKMQPLAEMAMQPVREGKIEFLPKRFEKIFFHWMNNTIDWNISRQIVWGISIPAKICTNCDQGFPDLENTLSTCSHCQGTLVADPDTFDTWFSSGQWPLLTLGYPDSKDFQEYYPTDVMETGADLVFKWVPRMIMFGMYLAKKEPFKTVYFHGMVNDEHNQKMSKSKGNVISPVELSDQFGTDAMRMALITG
ncbi:MAG: valine--tRNA ligase, partial [Patescibacteria group bacterium]